MGVRGIINLVLFHSDIGYISTKDPELETQFDRSEDVSKFTRPVVSFRRRCSRIQLPQPHPGVPNENKSHEKTDASRTVR